MVVLMRARPGTILEEFRDSLPTSAPLTTIWCIIDRLGLTVRRKVHAERATAANGSPPRSTWGIRSKLLALYSSLKGCPSSGDLQNGLGAT